MEECWRRTGQGARRVAAWRRVSQRLASLAPAAQRTLGSVLVVWMVAGPVLAGDAGDAGDAGEAPASAELDARCLRQSGNETAFGVCLRRSSAGSVRKLSFLMAELGEKLPRNRFASLEAVQTRWRSFVFHDCRWQSGEDRRADAGRDTLGRCVRQATAARVRQLKRFVCADGGVAGACEASMKY